MRMMRAATHHLRSLILASVAAVAAASQAQAIHAAPNSAQAQSSRAFVPSQTSADAAASPNVASIQQQLNAAAAGVKFNLRDLMATLSDRNHEGWVLAAYPDPKTGRPLIGAGFSLDLPAREHPQSDLFNSREFIEPSSADLWQAAGLKPERLQTILDQFNDRLAAWNKRGFRKRINRVAPQITDQEATQLLRVAALQAVHNARAYCRNFDGLSGPQQMAMSQLVYQMGVNLEEFSQFLGQINSEFEREEVRDSAASARVFPTATEYWRAAQQALIQSQWARAYSARAISVIAMLDPHYGNGASIAEQRVSAMLHPAAFREESAAPAPMLQRASRKTPTGNRRGAGRKGKAASHPSRGI